MSILYNKIYLLAAATALSLSLSSFSSAYADDNEVEEKEEIEEIVVTGSRFKKNNYETASPVVVITQEDIQKIGASTVFEVLLKLPEVGSFFGSDRVKSFTQGYFLGSDAAIGAQSVSLRGLGSNATLILVNGKKIAKYGLLENRQTTITSLDAIALDSIERIEVLKAGASSIYGSDAMAGVINIILRKDYEGKMLIANFGISTMGDYEKYRLSYTQGFSGIGGGDNNLTISGNFSLIPSIKGVKRGRSSMVHNDAPGTLSKVSRDPVTRKYVWSYKPLDANNCDEISDKNKCLRDINNKIYSRQKRESIGLNLSFNHSFEGDLEFFSDLSISHRKTNGIYRAEIAWIKNYKNTGYELATSFVDVGSRSNNTIATSYDFALGFKGDNLLDMFRWEVYLKHSESHVNVKSKNFILEAPYKTLLAEGKLDFSKRGGMDKSIVDQLRAPELTRKGKGTRSDFEAFISADSFNFFGIDASFLLGGNFNRQSQKDTPDPFLKQEIQNNGSNNGKTPVMGIVHQGNYEARSRKSGALFGEFHLPLTERLETSISYRYDIDDIFDSHLSPAANFRWKMDEHGVVSIRGGYSTGFRAPSLGQFGVPTYISPRKRGVRVEDYAKFPCADKTKGGLIPWGPKYKYCFVTVINKDNPDIKPETSKSYNLGVILNPSEGFFASIDWFHIKRKNEIKKLQDPTILEFYPEWLVKNEQGEITGMHNYYGNIGYTINEGVDFTIKYSFSLEDVGRFEIRTQASRLINTEENIFGKRGGSEYSAGFSGKPLWRGNVQVNWSKDDWAASLTYYYRGKYKWKSWKDNDRSFYCDLEALNKKAKEWQTYTRCDIKSFSTVNLNLRYTGLEGVKLILNINNLFDSVEDRRYMEDRRFKGNDLAFQKTIGRYVKLTAQWRF